MKKNLIILFCLVLCVFCFSFGVSAAPTPWNGTADTSWYNTTDASFEINTAEKLAGLAKLVNDGTDTFAGKTVKLTADLDLGGVKTENDWNALTGKNWTPVGSGSSKAFQGVFNGNGHLVSNLYLKTSVNYQGIFGYTSGSAKIKNLSIAGGSVSGSMYTASLLGYGAGNTVILNCSTAAEVNGTNYVGGLVGYISSATGYIVNSCNSGKVSFTAAVGGGVCGGSYGSFLNCYNTGAITGTQASPRIGGVAGQSFSSSVYDNCYNAGIIAAPNVGTGGIMGSLAGMGYTSSWNGSTYSVYRNSYYLQQSVGVYTLYGVGGFTAQSEGTEGKITIGKNAEGLKGIAGDLGAGYVADSGNDNNGYPLLKWQKKVGGSFNYDEDETDTLALNAAIGIYDADSDGFKVNFNKKLVYTTLSNDEFDITVQMGGKEVTLNNLKVALDNTGEVTVLSVSFQSLGAEKEMTFSIAYGSGAALTKTFTSPASELWTDYAASDFAAGDGSMTDPYQIATAEQLAYFSYNSDTFKEKFVELTADIELTGKYWTPKNFAGNFDGQGFAIKNMAIKSSPSSSYAGFIYSISTIKTDSALYIQNLILENPQVEVSANYVGALAGYAQDVSIANCHIIGGKVTNTYQYGYTGGLLGNVGCKKDISMTTSVENCSSTATVTGNSAAGIAGSVFFGNANSSGYIEFNDCYAGGSANGRYVGGLICTVSHMKGVIVNHCYATAAVNGTLAENAGGLASYITYTGSQAVGADGINVMNSVAENAYVSDGTTEGAMNASGRIAAAASLIVENGKGSFTNNYALETMKVNGGYAEPSVNNGESVTAQEMGTKEFWKDTLGFDLDTVWQWNEAASRPVLNAKNLAAIEVSIISQPQNAIVYNNQSAVFGVEADGGNRGYTYQWYYNTNKGSSWTEIDEATDAALYVAKSDAYAKNNAMFRCEVKDCSGHGIISESGVLTVADARFNLATATDALVTYYQNRGIISNSQEAFALSTELSDLTEFTTDLNTYNKYYPTGSSNDKRGMFPWVFMDSFALGGDVTEYQVTGKGTPNTEDLPAVVLSTQNEKTGEINATAGAMFGLNGKNDVPLMVLAMDMYFAGGEWGNEKEGTLLGRTGAIQYIFDNLKDYSGGGQYFYTLSTYASNYYPNHTQLAQCNTVMLMSRFAEDPAFGDEAKAAMVSIMQTMENLYDSGKILDTEVAARYVSALVAYANTTDSILEKYDALSTAKNILNDDILTSICADGSYSLKLKAGGLKGDADATAGVMLAFGDFDNESALLSTYQYKLPDINVVTKDAEVLSVNSPVLEDIELPVKGQYGSEIAWQTTNKNVLSVTGKVNRTSVDVEVTLTATITKGEALVVKEFPLTVKAAADADTDSIDTALSFITLPTEAYENIIVPDSTVEGVIFGWISSDEGILGTDGTVTRPAEADGDAVVTLTVTAAKGEVEKTKDFKIKIYAETTDKIKGAYYQTRNYYMSNRSVGGYWNIFAAYAALGEELQDPANGYTFALEKPTSDWYGTQYGATVLAICAMGENPYNYNGTNWVKLLEDNYGGIYAGGTYSQLGMNAAGADKTTYLYGPTAGISQTQPSAMAMGIDIAGWAATILGSHYGEEGTQTAAADFIKFLKERSFSADGNSSGSNYISSACAIVGLNALQSVGVEGADVTAAGWQHGDTGKGYVDAAYDAVFGNNFIPGYNSQIQMALCDLYNVKYGNTSTAWITCGVTKDKLDNQIAKANAILADKEAYEAASVKSIEDALTAVNGISADRLNAKIADYGEEYYTLYDAVRYAKAVSQNDIDAAAAAIVTEQINDLPADITLNSKEAVAYVRTAYDALTKDQKDLVEANVLKKLTDAESTIAGLEQGAVDEKAADEAAKTINALPDKVTLKDQSAVEAARAAYDKLTAAQKKLVAEAAVTKLTDAEAQIKAILDKKGVDVENMTDVKEADWFYNDVAYCLENGLFFGTSASTFGPYEAMTRGQFVTILGRNAGISDASGAYPTMTVFDDVDSSAYYASHVKWAVEKGITAGTSKNTFHPNAAITRQDMATMMLRYAKATGIELPAASAEKFADDGNIADYAKEAVYRLKAAKILTGKDNQRFDPKGTTLRCEIAAVLHRFLTYDPAADLLADDSNAVIVSMEKFTLGQGYVIEPSIVKLQENDTVASVLLRVAEAKGLEMEYDPGSSFYLRNVKDNDTSAAVIPQYILDAAEAEDETLGDRATAGWLSEFDYTSQGGWMYWLNNTEIQYSAGDPINAVVKAGDVIRWQFTVVGLGRDLGSTFYNDAYVTVADKDALTHAVAVASKNQKKSVAYSEALTVLQNMEATQAQVDAVLGALTE